MLKHETLIKKMTIEEKASMLSGKNFWETRDIEYLNIPSMFLADGPHGLRRQAKSADHLGLNPSLKATCFPTSATIANSFDKKIAYAVGVALGKEAIDQQVNVLLGPGTNIKRNPLCGRNFEYFSEDPYLSGVLASSVIQGIQTQGVAACVKHYAANNQEYRRLVINSNIDERALREIYLTPFEMAVKEGKVKTLMSAYNKVNGSYANESTYLLNQVLRKEWQYNGLVITDWGGSNDRISGLKATNEIEMPSTGYETNYDVIKAVQAGLIEESLVDEAVDRIIDLALETTKALNTKTEIDYQAHHALATKAHESSIVLLRNEDHILPLNKTDKVGFIGDLLIHPRYQGAGSSKVNPYYIEHTLDIVKLYPFDYQGFEKGYNRLKQTPSKSLEYKAIQLAKKVDKVVLYIGLDEASEAEGVDRPSMKLPQNQLDLIKKVAAVNPNVIAVIHAGSQVEIDFDKSVKGLLNGYLGGQGYAKALLNVLTGKVNPSGRFSETLPYVYEDNPSSHNFPGDETDVNYEESIYVGYRYYEKYAVPVKYPFGYGLSYTTFLFTNLKADHQEVTFDITNTGELDGSVVAQLYVGQKDTPIDKPIKELKGFEKVFIEKGQTVSVKIPFDAYTFRYFDVDQKQFEVIEGTYQLYVGNSIEDIKLETSIEVIGSIKAVDVKSKAQIMIIKKAEPNSQPKVKKKKIHVHYNTTVVELKHAKGFTGRLFANTILFAHLILVKFNKRTKANTLMMGVMHQPMRSLSRMTSGTLSFKQLDGLIMMFNGHLFKGLKHIIKYNKEKKQFKKKEIERIKQTKLAIHLDGKQKVH